ncbi:hypothetical protein N39L_36620 [Limnospira platensis NIES-39]|nr:hypothetical protein N39L_36620 [Arthrospira platensis NIES-39]
MAIASLKKGLTNQDYEQRMEDNPVDQGSTESFQAPKEYIPSS